MKRILCLIITVLILVCSLTACGKSGAYKNSEEYEGAVTADYLTDNAAPAEKAASEPSREGRKLITTVSATLETEHYGDCVEKINAAVNELGGYIESSDESARYSSKLRTASYTVRVPADKTGEFLASVSESGTVMNKSVSTSDVTLQYSDTEAHLAALETEQASLLELLSKATALSDILEIQRELTSVRAEIETYNKRLIVYDNKIEYSTVHLTVNEVKEEIAENPGAFKRITHGFVKSLENIGKAAGEFFIWFISSLPYFVVIGAAAALVIAVIRALKRRKAKRRAAKEEQKKEQ